MSELNKTLENLLNKSIEVNKSFIEEGAKLLKRYSESGKQFSNLNVFQNKVLSNALNADFESMCTSSRMYTLYFE